MIRDKFIFDINKIMEFVFDNPNGRTKDVEITENFVYDDESEKMIPSIKEVKEYKVNDFTNQNTIRYDMVKMFIEILDSIEDENIMTVGQNITLNTMQAYELIKEIKNEMNNE